MTVSNGTSDRDDKLLERINKQKLIENRRYFHQNPELSFQEFETAKTVASFLHSFGLEVETGVGGNGVVATLNGKFPGPTIALRCDMDALPIQDEKQVEYRSAKKGIMHACGHDGHMSILLEVARLLTEEKDQLHGKVKFVFQHAEELVPGGAKSILESGALDDVEAIFGIHLWSGFETGKIGVKSGPVMASSDHFDIHLFGKGGHGGLPHNAVDLIFLSSQLLNQFQAIVSRRINPIHSAAISIGSINGGETYNVLPSELSMKGTVRCFDNKTRETIKGYLLDSIQHICDLYGASFEFDYHDGYPPVINHENESATVAQVVEQYLPSGTFFKMEPLTAGEDFAYYLEKIPGCFFFVGCRNENKNSVFPHHHARFDIDEDALPIAVQTFYRLVKNYCSG
jgi:amidohydrolase